MLSDAHDMGRYKKVGLSRIIRKKSETFDDPEWQG
jgi:hypothetical protein